VIQLPDATAAPPADPGDRGGALRRFLTLCPGEPFRIFFPFGLLLGIAGVTLWPSFFAGALTAYPSVAHARLMIEGMMAAFIFGFLGTAGPRLTETRRLSPAEVGVLLALQLGACVWHVASRPAWGDAFFLVTLLFFMRTLGLRFGARRDLPPPNFVLVAFGMISGVLGSALLLFSEAVQPSPLLQQFGGALLNQGFVLFPVLGAGAFLLRKFLDLDEGDDAPAMRQPSPEWSAQARRFAGVSLVIIASFALEAFDFPVAAGIVRAAAIAIYLVTAMPLFARPGSFLAHCLRLGLLSVFLAPIWLAVYPLRPVAGVHILVIGGFSVIVFAVGTRVILGHGGQAHLLRRRLPFLAVVIGLVLLSLLTRLGAEFVVASRVEHLVLAAIIWLAAALLWGIRLLPHLATPDQGH